MRHIFRFILLTCCISIAVKTAGYAQLKADSLRRLLVANTGDDTIKVKLLLLLANDYELYSADSVYKFGGEALRISSQLDYKKGVANSYEMLGTANAKKDRYDTALTYYYKSLSIAKHAGEENILSSKYNHIANAYILKGKYADANIYYDSAIRSAIKSGDLETEAKANSNLANVYYKMGSYTVALRFYLKGLSVQERMGIADNIASDLANIANVYYRLGNYNKAIAYNDRAVALNKKSAIKERLIGSLTTYALIYNDKKLYDSSLYYLNQALDLAEELKSPYLQNILIGNIAECYLKKGAYDKAYKLYLQSLQMSATLGDDEGSAIAKSGIGEVLLQQGNGSGGRKHMAEALDAMQQLGIKEQAMNIAAKLSRSYEADGDHKNALYYLRTENALSDSLKKQKAGQEAGQLIFTYEMQKKEAEIKLLQQDNIIKEHKNRNQQIMLLTVVLFLILMVATSYLLYINIKGLRKSRALIISQKEEIEKQAANLTELNSFKDTAVSLLAHDLRNPVNALTSTIMLLDENIISPEEFASYKVELNNRLQSVSILLDNMLYWAQGQMKGNVLAHREKLNIKLKTLRALSVLNDAAKQKNISIVNNVTEDVSAYADRDHLDIAVRNLLSNAIKFTRDEGEIILSASQDGHNTRISIADNGVGMTPEQVAKLFKQDIYTTTVGTVGEKGTGLGLMLSYDLIRKNNGDIIVSSVNGKGSIFTIILPSPSSEMNQSS